MGIGRGNYIRHSRQITLEETRRLDIRQLRKAGYLENGKTGSWSWHRGDEHYGSINIETFSEFTKLAYRIYSRDSKNESHIINQKIYLEKTPCNYGGFRSWFLCPKCGRRVEILALQNNRFYCRHCHKLPYGSNREPMISRLIRKRDKIEKMISSSLYAKKPKGMHQKTFDRLAKSHWDLDLEIDSYIYARFSNLSA